MNTNTHKVTVGKVVQYLILILMFLLLVGPFVWEPFYLVVSLAFKCSSAEEYFGNESGKICWSLCVGYYTRLFYDIARVEIVL